MMRRIEPGARVCLATHNAGKVREIAALLAPAAGSPYRVSFQIVLQANGRVELNYGRVPPVSDAPPPVTIGVRAADGRLLAAAETERRGGGSAGVVHPAG